MEANVLLLSPAAFLPVRMCHNWEARGRNSASTCNRTEVTYPAAS